jgi:excisionase family DNA binding protein
MPDYTVGQIATRLSVAPRTVTKWIDAGQLRGYRLPGSGHRRVRGVELLDFVRRFDLPLELLSDTGEPPGEPKASAPRAFPGEPGGVSPGVSSDEPVFP